jgi:hypothetical protein
MMRWRARRETGNVQAGEYHYWGSCYDIVFSVSDFLEEGNSVLKLRMCHKS